MLTPNMNLELATVSVTIGPLWATNINTALTAVDLHDHSSGKGVRIPSAGININANLNVNEYTFYNFKSTRYEEQVAALTGVNNLNAIHSVNGDLYWTNGAGTAVPITSGSILATTSGVASIFEYVTANTNLTINPSEEFAFIEVDASGGAININLPLAASILPGRFYIIKDIEGSSNTNNITITADGSDEIDGASTDVIDSDFAARMYVTDGISKWSRA
jgi:hypothetical protein